MYIVEIFLNIFFLLRFIFFKKYENVNQFKNLIFLSLDVYVYFDFHCFIIYLHVLLLVNTHLDREKDRNRHMLLFQRS
jgi:hypothetical protein